MTAETATTKGARDHARAMSGTVVDAMPTIPSTAASDLPDGVDAADVVWDEVVAGGGYTSLVLPVGARVRLTDVVGDTCAGVLLHRADHPSERLNVADTVKVQWQAYLGQGSLLLSDMGRALATIVEDTSGRHDTLCGTTTEASNSARYGDGTASGPCPNGRDRFAVALAKSGRSRREIAPNINLFKGVTVAADGSLELDGEPRPGTYVTLRADLPILVTIVVVPHPLDDRPGYTVSDLRVTAWRGEPGTATDSATPEAERAYLNSEQALR
jgi:uncharacterized protein